MSHCVAEEVKLDWSLERYAPTLQGLRKDQQDACMEPHKYHCSVCTCLYPWRRFDACQSRRTGMTNAGGCGLFYRDKRFFYLRSQHDHFVDSVRSRTCRGGVAKHQPHGGVLYLPGSPRPGSLILWPVSPYIDFR